MTVIEAVLMFDQLARLCPQIVPTEEERVLRIMDMFRTELAVIIDSGGSPLATVAECIEQALYAEFRLAKDKDERIKRYEARRNQSKLKIDTSSKGQGQKGGLSNN